MAISLEKGKKVNLRKQEKTGLGEILVNLNWNSKPAKKGFLGSLFGGGSKPIDLDLGCLYELKNGRKGTVQALGNAFGSLQQEPYIALDGDDRTGAVARTCASTATTLPTSSACWSTPISMRVWPTGSRPTPWSPFAIPARRTWW